MRCTGMAVSLVAAASILAACTVATDGEPVVIEGNRAESIPGPVLEQAPVVTPEPATTRTASNVPMTRLAAGETPPQFVLFSFDGVGLTPNWDMFLDAADRVDARFSALMTGLYFLTDGNATHYQGPGHGPGRAAIAFGGGEADVVDVDVAPRVAAAIGAPTTGSPPGPTYCSARTKYEGAAPSAWKAHWTS